MHCTQRSGATAVSGKQFLAGGFIAAALMAGGVAGAACAAASPTENGNDASQTSASAAGPSTTETSERADRSDTSTTSGDDHADSASESDADAPPKPRHQRAHEDTEATEPTAGDSRPARHDRTRRAERLRAAATVDTPEPVTRRSARTTAPDPEPVTAKAVTTTLATATTATAATATASDPVLFAAATSTRVTVGSMIIDSLYSMGIRSSRMGTTWLDIPVSRTTADRWLVKRKRIYRDVVSTPPQPTLLWETNFSSHEEALKYWGLQTGRWGQSAGENQYYTDGGNMTIDANGDLVITARREPAPDGLGAPYNYTSARVVTYGKQSIGVGTRVEARIKMPVDQGVLPAFWTVGLEPGHEFDWPRQGEIDIAEVPGFGTPEAARTWTGNIHGPAASNNGVDVKLDGVDADLGTNLSADFHVYGMDWYSDRIIWRVDGVEVGRVTKAQYEALGGNWTPFSGAWQHYLILNVAVGNPWTGDPSASAPLNAEMTVDWVRAYQL